MDAALIFDPDTRAADLSLTGGQIATESGLKTAIILSLFSDARVGVDELPQGETDRRGFWADALTGDNFGSKLWLLARGKRTETVRARAEAYAKEALAWLVTDQIARRVEVTAAWVGPADRTTLAFSVVVERANGDRESHRFDDMWAALQQELTNHAA